MQILSRKSNTETINYEINKRTNETHQIPKKTLATMQKISSKHWFTRETQKSVNGKINNQEKKPRHNNFTDDKNSQSVVMVGKFILVRNVEL